MAPFVVMHAFGARLRHTFAGAFQVALCRVSVPQSRAFLRDSGLSRSGAPITEEAERPSRCVAACRPLISTQ